MTHPTETAIAMETSGNVISPEVEALRKERTIAKRKFTRVVTNIKNAMDNKAEMSIITAKLIELKTVWNDVQDKHDEYVTTVYSDEEDQAKEDEWISKVEASYNLLETAIMNFGKEKEIKEKNDKADLNQKAYALAEVSFETTIDVVKKYLESETTKSYETLRDMKQSINDNYRKCIEMKEKCLSAMNAEDDISMITNRLSELEITRQGMLDNINLLLPENSITRGDESIVKTRGCNELKLERMKLPKFDGDIRNYPRFKADFKGRVMPDMKNDEMAAYVLKSCLIEPVDRIVRNVDDDLNLMWDRLDEKFGRPSKLAEVIMQDIKNIKKIQEGDHQAFVETVDLIECCYHDLKLIKYESEISNSTVLSMIESKLPLEMKLKWSERINASISETEELNKFPALLSFLKEQRRIIEYVISDFRKETRGKQTSHAVAVNLTENVTQSDGSQIQTDLFRCFVHNSNSHKTENCREYLSMSSEQKLKLLKESRACWSCLRPRHRAAECRSKVPCPIDDCGKFHHESLHAAHVEGVRFNPQAVLIAGAMPPREAFKGNSCLLQIMSISAVGAPPMDHQIGTAVI